MPAERISRCLGRACVAACALLAALPSPAGAGVELAVAAEIAPFGRALDLPVWVEYRLHGRYEEERHLFRLATEDRLYTRFTLTAGRRPVEGRLEAVLFPATVYVGRSCPPQEHAELEAVRPRAGGGDRREIPVAAGVRRGGWVAFAPGGAESLTARYQCFHAGYELEAADLPPDPAVPPPQAPAAESQEGEAGGEGGARETAGGLAGAGERK